MYTNIAFSVTLVNAITAQLGEGVKDKGARAPERFF